MQIALAILSTAPLPDCWFIAMKLFDKMLDAVPLPLISRAFGTLSDHEFPQTVQASINRAFASLVRLDQSEAELPIHTYPSLNKLFTRNLKDNARTICANTDNDVVSPVDGTISFIGQLDDTSLIHAKNRKYNVQSLVAAPTLEPWLRNAFAFIIYLSPANYHQIHSPVCGCVSHIAYAPGRLLPVNALGYLLTNNLLPTNERLTSFFTLNNGQHAALVKVGATCVGRISVRYDDFQTNACRKKSPFFKTLPVPFDLKIGDKLGCFELGSTVVLLLQSDTFKPNPDLSIGQTIKLGSLLGSF